MSSMSSGGILGKSPSLAKSIILDTPVRDSFGKQSIKTTITEEIFEKSTTFERISIKGFQTPLKGLGESSMVDSLSYSVNIEKPSDKKVNQSNWTSDKKISIMTERPSEKKQDGRPSHLRSKSSGVFTVKLPELDPELDPLNRSFDPSTRISEVRSMKIPDLARRGPVAREGVFKALETDEKIMLIDVNKPEESKRSRFNLLREALAQTKAKFVDDLFLPDHTSIFNNKKRSMLQLHKYAWERFPSVYKGEKLKLCHMIDPNDVQVGEANNAYLVSALSALAEFPKRILKLLEDQELNDQSIYFVKICRDGLWRYVILDDLFPCLGDPRTFAFVRNRSLGGVRELWAPLIEKALAKIFSGYQNIESGHCAETLHDLTGAPIQKISTASLNIWDFLLEACQKKWIVVASCSNTESSRDSFRKVGLVPGFSYSVLSVRETQHQGKKERLIELRNPWGWNQEEWRGKWSDSWVGWTEELLERLEKKGAKNDGRFFMDINDFRSVFSVVSVCKVHEDYFYIATPVRQNKNAFSIRALRLTQKTQCYLELTQFDKRYYRGLKYNYAFSRIIIGRQNQDGSVEYVGGTCGRQRNLHVALELDPGSYFIITSSDWKERTYDIILSYYGSSHAQIERIDFLKNSDLLDIIMVDAAVKMGAKQLDVKKEVMYFSLVAKNLGIVVECYKNITKDKEVTIYIDYTRLGEMFFPTRDYTLEKGSKFVKDAVNMTLNFSLKIPIDAAKAVCTKLVDMDRYDISLLNDDNLKNYGFR